MPKKGILLVGNILRRINELSNSKSELNYFTKVLLKNHAQTTHVEHQF